MLGRFVHLVDVATGPSCSYKRPTPNISPPDQRWAGLGISWMSLPARDVRTQMGEGENVALEFVASKSGLQCDLVRMETIKKKTTKTLPGADFSYKVERGQKSIKGQHGPAK